MAGSRATRFAGSALKMRLPAVACSEDALSHRHAGSDRSESGRRPRSSAASGILPLPAHRYTGVMPPRSEPSEPPRTAPLVRTRGNRRTLEFQDGDIQSEMLLSHPDALVLDYARAMMCFALFVPDPRHI